MGISPFGISHQGLSQAQNGSKAAKGPRLAPPKEIKEQEKKWFWNTEILVFLDSGSPSDQGIIPYHQFTTLIFNLILGFTQAHFTTRWCTRSKIFLFDQSKSFDFLFRFLVLELVRIVFISSLLLRTENEFMNVYERNFRFCPLDGAHAISS